MLDNADQLLPDVRNEGMANLVRNHAAMTALDRVMSVNSSSNRFNNCISADPGSSIK